MVYKPVVNRIAANFRYKDFDPKWVFRLIMNSKVYQREMRTVSSPAGLFTAVRPSRLRPDVVAASVKKLIGEDKKLNQEIMQAFDMNPSLPQGALEGSIQQALLLMNHATLQSKLAKSELKKQLVNISSDKEMLHTLYLNVLARHATEQELQRSIYYLNESQTRTEAIDDLIWVLINSTEFRTKR